MWWLLAGMMTATAWLLRSREPKVEVTRAMAAIKAVESGNNYGAQNGHSSASGAYQFLDTTWGGYGGYTRAKDAPPYVQDQKAASAINGIVKRFGKDPKWIPAAWYAGMRGAAEYDWDTVLPGNRSSIEQYVDKWMKVYNGL